MRRRASHIFEKEKRGHYVEPMWCSRRLFEVERFGEHVHDPACGWGTILIEAAGAGYEVSGSDIIDRRRHKLGNNFFKRDFLTWHGSLRNKSVVCNPPFDHVQEFCEHSLDLGAQKIAMICLVRRLNAAHWLQECPLRRIWLLTPRPSMPPGSWIAKGNKPGGGTQDFVWLVFERGYAGDATIDWLHRDVYWAKEEESDGRPVRRRSEGTARRGSEPVAEEA